MNIDQDKYIIKLNHRDTEYTEERAASLELKKRNLEIRKETGLFVSS